MKILLGDFNAKVGREDIFKTTVRNESLHEISIDSGVRVVNFSTLKKYDCQEYSVHTSQYSRMHLNFS
jgi:hypothetical protein